MSVTEPQTIAVIIGIVIVVWALAVTAVQLWREW